MPTLQELLSQGKPIPPGQYTAYINSDYWREKRRGVLLARGRKCERCSKTTGVIHVHHLTYQRLGRELPEDLKVLCEACHYWIHNGKPLRQRGGRRRTPRLRHKRRGPRSYCELCGRRECPGAALLRYRARGSGRLVPVCPVCVEKRHWKVACLTASPGSRQ
jgi:hypothetical protein